MPGPIDLADISASTASLFEGLPTTRTLQLKKYETDPWSFNDSSTPRPPTTPSEWFSKHFPQQAQLYGCPFIELKETAGVGIHTIDPLAINTDFFAAILGGDKKLKHSVVYVESEMQFYYYDPLEKVHKPASEDKLGSLMRGYLIRCAEELGNDVRKWLLFTEFRSDKTIRAIVHRAKSILACEPGYFSVESKHQRQQGPELYERIALAFVQQILERAAGETLLLTDVYIHFLEYLSKRKMPPVNRKTFNSIVPAAIQRQFDLGIRHDVVDNEENGSHYGWKGIRAVDLEPAIQKK